MGLLVPAWCLPGLGKGSHSIRGSGKAASSACVETKKGEKRKGKFLPRSVFLGMSIDDLARLPGCFSMSLPLAPCLEQLSQRDGKAKSGEQSQGWGWHLQGRIVSAKPTSKSSRSQEPPPADFLSCDPWSEHPPCSPSICTASYSIFCSIPKCRTNNQLREMVSQPEPFSHPNSCLCKLSAIPVTMAFTPQRCCRPVEGKSFPTCPPFQAQHYHVMSKQEGINPHLPPAPWFGPATLEGISPDLKSSNKGRSGPLWVPSSPCSNGLLDVWRSPSVPFPLGLAGRWQCQA